MPGSPDLIARGLGATDSELGLASAIVFHVYIRGSDFTRLGELTEWTSFNFSPKFNGLGTWALETSADSLEAALLTKRGGIIITREIGGVETTVFSGPVVTEWGYTGTTFRAAGYCDNYWLLEPARPNPSESEPPFSADYHVLTNTASVVMRLLVAYNIGPLAPTDRQLVPIGFPVDPLLGSTITSRANLQPLLTLLAELAITPYTGGLGFYLRQSDVIAGLLEFIVYAPPDRSADAKFSIDLGTIQDYEDIAEAPAGNRVYVMGGDGFGANRTIVYVEDADSIAEWGQMPAITIDQRGTTDTGELNQKAAEAIAGVSTLRRTAVTPFDVPSLQYGADYDLGTLVTVVTRGGEVVDLVRAVEVSLDPERGAVITPVVGQGDGSDEERTQTITRTIQDRVQNLERNWNVPDGSVTPAMLAMIDSPADNELYVYDGATERGEWIALPALAAAVTFTTITASGAVQGSTLTASGAVQGTRLISTVATGTAPLTVSSTTEVANLNAERVGGQTLANLDGRYVDIGGDSMTGMLTIEPTVGTQQSLKLKYNAAGGGFFLGATNSATPSLILKDNSNTQVAAFGYSTDTNQLVVNGVADITGTAKAAKVVAGGSTFVSTEVLRAVGDANISADLYVGDDAEIAGDLTASRIAAGATTFSSSEELRVVGQTRLEGLVEVIGNDIRLEQTYALRGTDGAAWRNLAAVDSGDILQYGENGATGAVVNGGYVQIKSAGTVRFEVNSTGIGFYGAGPAVKQTIVGAKGGNVALANLLTGLSNIGLIIDLTT